MRLQTHKFFLSTHPKRKRGDLADMWTDLRIFEQIRRDLKGFERI